MLSIHRRRSESVGVDVSTELSNPMIVPPELEVVLNQATIEKPPGFVYEFVVST